MPSRHWQREAQVTSALHGWTSATNPTGTFTTGPRPTAGRPGRAKPCYRALSLVTTTFSPMASGFLLAITSIWTLTISRTLRLRGGRVTTGSHPGTFGTHVSCIRAFEVISLTSVQLDAHRKVPFDSAQDRFSPSRLGETYLLAVLRAICQLALNRNYTHPM